MSAISFLPFEDWRHFIFDHEPTGPEWYADACAPYWNAPTDLTAQYLIRLFSDPCIHLERYSDEQINKGLWYLISPGLGEHMLCLDDERLALSIRTSVVRSCIHLFKLLFQFRCSRHLSHSDWIHAAPLNSICYMWWDIMPVYGGPVEADRKALQRAAIDVMSEILNLDNVACQESALHGLGHWRQYDPDGIAATIDRFLSGGQHAPDLRQYAVSARCGCVL